MATISRRQREKLQRRNDILNAAERKFFAKDYDDVSMDEIARELELSKPTLYLYFRNKESLFFAVVLRGIAVMRDAFENAVESSQTGIEKIRSLCRAIFDFMLKYRDYYRLNVVARGQRFWNAFSNGEVEAADTYVNYVTELFNLIKESVDAGIDDGTLRGDLDPMQAAMFLSAAIETTVLLAPYNELLLNQTGLKLEDYQQQAMEILLRGIVGNSEYQTKVVQKK